MELSRRTIQRMILRKSGDTTVINQGSEGGGSQPSVALGPLLTSLNAEAMPSAEGYLHWTGSAWAFDTPTGGDPVDLTPYALKTWVQDNFAYKNDLVNFITKTEADGYYAALSHTHANYLPLSAGSSKPLTGSLYITGNSGITWVGGYGMMCFKPTNNSWAGVTENQWGVGSHSAQGVIRSSLELKRYDGTYQYTIWDTSNFDPLNYISKDGGTVAGTLNVRTQLNIQSAAGANKISIDGTTPNIDIASGGQLTFDVDSHIYHDPTNDRLVIHGNNGLLIDSDTYVGTVDGGNQVATRNYVGSQLELFDNYMQQWTSGQYLKLYGGGTLSGGNVTMVGNSLLFKRTAGGSYDGAIFASTVTPPGYQSAVGCITIGGPVNFDNDGAPPMVNGKYIATEQWVLNKGYITETNADDRYVSKNGGTVNGNLNVKGTIQAQDSNGNNKVIIYGSSGNIRAEKVYIGGSTSGYEAATHDWVTGQGYQENVIESVKVNGTALTPTNKAVNIPAATSDGSTFGVVAIGTGFTFDEDRLCVDTSTFATRTWADGRYLPLTAGTDKKLTGNLFFNTVGRGIYLKNPTVSGQTDSWFPAIYQNSSNLWIGAIASSATHHLGQTYISAGYDVASSKGNPTIYVSVPNASNNSALNYGVWHMGNLPTADVNAFIKGVSISNIPLSPVDRVVNIPMAETNVPGVIQIGTGLINNESHTEVDTTVIASRTWADGRYLPLTAGSSKPLTGDLYLSEDLVINNEKFIYFKNHSGTLCDALSHSYDEDAGIDTLYLGFDFRKSSHSTEIYGNKLTLLTGASARERLVITSGGNVGIGTTSPAYKLDVNGNTGVTGSLDVSIELSVGDVTNGGVWLSDSALGVWTMSGTSRQDTELMSLASGGVTFSGDTIMTGKLAVGTTTFDGSNAKLQVGGNMFATGSITSKSNAGNVSLGNGNISATNLYISTVVFGSSNNDPAIYIGNGHVYARNSQGQTTMII